MVLLMCLLAGRAELGINQLEKTNKVNKTVNGTGMASSDFHIHGYTPEIKRDRPYGLVL